MNTPLDKSDGSPWDIGYQDGFADGGNAVLGETWPVITAARLCLADAEAYARSLIKRAAVGGARASLNCETLRAAIDTFESSETVHAADDQPDPFVEAAGALADSVRSVIQTLDIAAQRPQSTSVSDPSQADWRDAARAHADALRDAIDTFERQA